MVVLIAQGWDQAGQQGQRHQGGAHCCSPHSRLSTAVHTAAARLAPIAEGWMAAAGIGGELSGSCRSPCKVSCLFWALGRPSAALRAIVKPASPHRSIGKRHGGPGVVSCRSRRPAACGRDPSAGRPQVRAHGGAGCHPGLAGGATAPLGAAAAAACCAAAACSVAPTKLVALHTPPSVRTAPPRMRWWSRSAAR